MEFGNEENEAMYSSSILYACLFLSFGWTTNCTAFGPIASADGHKFVPGSLVRGHASDVVQGRATIQIDEVLYGDAKLKDQTFIVQTSNEKSYGDGVVCPALKSGEKGIWAVVELYSSKLGSDGLKHYTHYVDWDDNSYEMKWPIREADTPTYEKAVAMASVLARLEVSKSRADFDATLSAMRNAEKDPFLETWESRLEKSCQGIAN